MVDFIVGLGERVRSIQQELNKYFSYIRDSKENSIHIGIDEPDNPEQGNLWIDTSGDPPINTILIRELPIDCTIGVEAVSREVSLDANINVDFSESYNITVGKDIDSTWYGYLKANYGEISNEWFLGGFINWVAINPQSNEFWFEALGPNVNYADSVDISFPEANKSYTFDGVSSGIPSKPGVFNDYIEDEELVNFFKDHIGKSIHMDITVKVKRGE